MKNTSCIIPFKTGRVFDGEGPSVENYITIKARIESSLYFRVLDEFPGDVTEKQKDGSIIVTFRLPDEEWIYSYLYRRRTLEALEPECIRQRIQKLFLSAGNISKGNRYAPSFSERLKPCIFSLQLSFLQNRAAVL